MMRHTVFAILAVIFLAACGAEVKKIHPDVVTVTESVYASVSVKPEGLYQAFSTMPGILDKVLVEEGDTVSEGQVLFELLSRNTEIATDNARLSEELARENYQGNANLLSTIQRDINTMTEQFRIDSLNYMRQQRLWEKRIGSLSDLENRKLKYESSKSTLENLTRKLEQTENQLKTGFRQSQNAVLSAQTNLDDFTIRSRMNGRVYEVLKEEGELVTQVTPLARVGEADSFIIEMLIDEVDIARVMLGQEALVTLDAYPGQVFHTEITKIQPIKDDRNQTFTIEARFKEKPKTLYAGLSGEANILISTKEKALTIPAEYLMEGSKVMTPDGEISVQVGMRTIDRVEILSGLDTSTYIIKP